jgi:hypothetical protein
LLHFEGADHVLDLAASSEGKVESLIARRVDQKARAGAQHASLGPKIP